MAPRNCGKGRPSTLFVSAEDLANDIHWQKGIRCNDCHGGNATSMEPREAHAFENGFRKIESAADVSKFCGHCHSNAEYMRKFNPEAHVDQVDEFLKSVHGQHLQANPADPRAATCNSCHPKHVVRASTDPASASHPSHLVETCSTCHPNAREGLLAGIHREAGEKNVEGDKQPLHCNRCHGDNVHGLPPVHDLSSPVFARGQLESCGQCHKKGLDEYLLSVHGRGLVESGLITSAVCSNCHGAHADFRGQGPPLTGAFLPSRRDVRRLSSFCRPTAAAKHPRSGGRSRFDERKGRARRGWQAQAHLHGLPPGA